MQLDIARLARSQFLLLCNGRQKLFEPNLFLAHHKMPPPLHAHGKNILHQPRKLGKLVDGSRKIASCTLLVTWLGGIGARHRWQHRLWQ